nr:hypothetical protein [Cressdnaviricota sp.]
MLEIKADNAFHFYLECRDRVNNQDVDPLIVSFRDDTPPSNSRDRQPRFVELLPYDEYVAEQTYFKRVTSSIDSVDKPSWAEKEVRDILNFDLNGRRRETYRLHQSKYDKFDLINDSGHRAEVKLVSSTNCSYIQQNARRFAMIYASSEQVETEDAAKYVIATCGERVLIGRSRVKRRWVNYSLVWKVTNLISRENFLRNHLYPNIISRACFSIERVLRDGKYVLVVRERYVGVAVREVLKGKKTFRVAYGLFIIRADMPPMLRSSSDYLQILVP